MRRLNELQCLAGKTALITGGAGHLGAAFAETFAELGAGIGLIDINSKGLADVGARVREEFKTSVDLYEADLEDEKQIHELVRELNATYGAIDILVNNGAFVGDANLSGWNESFEMQSVETWRRAFEVNLTAPFILSQSLLPKLQKSLSASIVNISSIYGAVGPDMRLYDRTEMGNPAAYGASKAGLIQLTRWLSTVLAPQVRVNAICSGGIWRNQDEKFVERYIARTPLERMATEEDLKGVMAYLATDLSKYVTGQVIAVDGGWTVW